MKDQDKYRECDEMFNKKVNELLNLCPNTNEDSEIVEFGYKSNNDDTLYSIADFGNIKNFIHTQIDLAEERVIEKILEKVRVYVEKVKVEEIYVSSIPLGVLAKILSSLKSENKNKDI